MCYIVVNETTLHRTVTNKPVCGEVNDGQNHEEPQYLKTYCSIEQADVVNTQDNPACSTTAELQVK